MNAFIYHLNIAQALFVIKANNKYSKVNCFFDNQQMASSFQNLSIDI